MKNVSVFSTMAALATLAAATWSGHAYAIEPGSNTPHEPGISNAIPAGALPPPGFYLTNDLSYVSGSLQDGSGNTVKGVAATNVIAYVEVPVLLWSTPWHILGAQYAVAVTQPILTISATTNGITANGVTTTRTGLFNTVITPGILSWQLPLGFFVSGSFSVYLPVGDTGDRGNGTSSQMHIANNTTTYAPGGAVSWFNGKGFEASLNLEYDVQTENDNFINTTVLVGGVFPTPLRVKYQSGDLLNLDYTFQQAFGKWTPGLVGYFVAQTTGDQTTTSTGAIPALGIPAMTTKSSVAATPGVNGSGNKFQKFAIGPSLSYNFGPVTFNARYTYDVYAHNAFQNNVFWFRFSLPL